MAADCLKLGVVSDLHLDAEWSRPKRLPVDAFIAAGDFYNGVCHPRTHELQEPVREYLEAALKPMFVVLGNHDLYNTDADSDALRDDSRQVQAMESVKGVTVLRSGIVADIRGFRLLGCSLWSGWNWGGLPLEAAEIRAQRQLLDPRCIPPHTHFIQRMRERYDRDLAGLRSDVAQAVADSQVPIVVTHFCPSRKSVHPKYTGDPLTPYFANDIPDWDPLFESVKLWIHGHTHHSFDYLIGGCRVYCNPRGYGSENKPSYKSGRVVKVPHSDSW